jgi:acyl transferase domain-containing protein/aryl carrier-like protein/NAD(P)-dependent dehydrogenase (short-subunit alcohol dehydrogenase family)
MSDLSENVDTNAGPEEKVGLDQAIAAVVGIFADATGFAEERVDPDREFNEIGVDSFMIQKLNARFKNIFGQISNTLFFEYSTIRALAGFLWETKREAFSMRGSAGRVSAPADESRSSSEARSSLGATTPPPLHGDAPTAPRRPIRLPQRAESARPPPPPLLPNSRSFGAEGATDSEVAIVGCVGQYPGARDVEALWQQLVNGANLIDSIPSDRWDADEHYAGPTPTPGKTYAKWGGFIDGVKAFDPAFFKITPRDAELIDPQDRKFLEVVWRLFDQSGYTEARRSEKHRNSVGVYVGAFFGHYELWGVTEHLHGAANVPNSAISLIANRVSYFFGLHGPSVALDTMCSSSLTAVHLACRALLSGECELAVAGGVNLILHPQKYLYLCQSRFLAKDGLCRSFGANGSGYVPGEGVGALLLKPLSKAIQDGDRIHATIVGTAINHTGRSNGFTVPNVPSQEDVIRKAFSRAQIDPRRVDYIEAHGTGTELGDPIEIEALRKVYGATDAGTERKIPIGSIKSNIGHLESAAGIAGITKVLLQMRHGMLVPSLHAEPENPLLRLEESPFRVQKEVAPWDTVGRASLDTRVAGVSSFGAGGSNAHVVLKSYPCGPRGHSSDLRLHILLWSAHSERSLRRNLEKRASHVLKTLRESKKDAQVAYLNDVSYTLACRKEKFDYRHYTVFADVDDLIARLEALLGSFERIDIKKKSADRSSLLDVPEASDFISELIRNRRWEFMARCWCDGMQLDWERWIDFSDCAVVSLPDYEFDVGEYWYPRRASLLEALPADSAGPAVDVAPTPVETAPRAPEPVTCGAPRTTVFRVTRSDAGESVGELGRIFTDSILLVHGTIEGWPASLASTAERAFRVEAKDDALSFRSLSDGTRCSAVELLRQCKGRRSVRIVDLVGVIADYPTLLLHCQFWVEAFKELRTRDLEIVQWVAPGASPYASLLGHMLQGLSFEYPRVKIQVLEAPSTEMHHAVSSRWPMRDGHFVSLGDGWTVPALVEVDRASAGAEPVLDADKFYVVAGGTRGLGLEAAKTLHGMGARRIVITGISPLPPVEDWVPIMLDPRHRQYRTIFALNQLKEKLRSLEIYIGPLDEREPVRAFFERCGIRHGRLGGAIYCPGAIDKEHFAFVGKTKDSMAKVLGPKVPALEAFSDVVEALGASFIVAFSSISGVMPLLAPGIVDYAAANSFLNDFVERKNANASASASASANTRYYSICWPSWKNIGMGEVIKDNRMTALGLHPIEAPEGRALLRTILSLPPAVYAPLKIDGAFDADRLLGLPGPAARSLRRAPDVEFDAASRPAAPASEVEAEIRRIVAAILKTREDALGRDVRFADMGVESVLMMEIQQAVERTLHVSLGPAALAQHPTLAAFSAHTASMVAVRQDTGAHAASSEATPKEPQAVATNRAPSAAKTDGRGYEGERSRIAIVGLAARLPGAENVRQFWSNLRHGRIAVAAGSRKDWVQSLQESSRVPIRIGELRSTPPSQGNVSDQRAQRDPNAELFLELARSALADAGRDVSSLARKKVGVYVGARSDHSANNILEYRKSLVPAVGQNFVAAHVSHAFDFRGASLVIDSACSSGLVAAHMACQSLASREIEMAVCGAVSLLLDQRAFSLLSAEGVLSQSGECRAFDESADGFVLGEGGAALVLRRLDDALRDGDRIIAVIESSGVNNNGRGLGITTPDVDANADLIDEVLNRIGVGPIDVRYVETNGTGVPASDMIELRAIEKAYSGRTNRPTLRIGTLKPNIGHLLSAAGIASLVKCAVAANQRAVCPMVNLRNESRYFNYEGSAIRLTREFTALEPDAVYFVGVNSLGDGGTNAHLVLSNEHCPKIDLDDPTEPADLDDASPGSAPWPLVPPQGREPEDAHRSIW